MQTQTPISIAPKPRPRSGRTPLQHKNSPADLIYTPSKPKPKPKPEPEEPQHFEISPSIRNSDDKENRPIIAAAVAAPLPPPVAAPLPPPVAAPLPPPAAAPPPQMQLPDAASSLAEELSAIKKKLERLKLDRENTERILKEKDAKLEAMATELENRGEFQKKLEIEVDRLFRLKELKSRCMRVSPMRTLRAKEQGKIVNETPSSSHQSEVRTEETMSFECESGGEECQVQSPGSACSQTE